MPPFLEASLLSRLKIAWSFGNLSGIMTARISKCALRAHLDIRGVLALERF